MREVEFNKLQVVRYLAWTFGLAYAVQVGVWALFSSENAIAGQLAMAAMMFVPTLGVVLSGAGARPKNGAKGDYPLLYPQKTAGRKVCPLGTEGDSPLLRHFSDLGWKPQIRKNIKTILIAWFAPAVLTAVGAALYFLAFPQHFDLSGEYVVASAGAKALDQLQAAGLDYAMYVVLGAVACVTYAPLANTVVALGEEIGWRGFLYPQLKARFGRARGLVLGGIIWGAWHWPLIWLIGYEYGAAAGNAAGYAGYPILGMLVFCVFTVALGVFCDWVYERSESIWLPALLHGAINAAATIPVMLCVIDTGTLRLLGPAPNGLIAGLPFLVVGAVLLARGKKV